MSLTAVDYMPRHLPRSSEQKKVHVIINTSKRISSYETPAQDPTIKMPKTRQVSQPSANSIEKIAKWNFDTTMTL
jgi:hypothetical protein